MQYSVDTTMLDHAEYEKCQYSASAILSMEYSRHSFEWCLVKGCLLVSRSLENVFLSFCSQDTQAFN